MKTMSCRLPFFDSVSYGSVHGCSPLMRRGGFSVLSALLLVCSSLLLAGLRPSMAQTTEQSFEKLEQLKVKGPAFLRAMNLARAKAVELNGGLSNYNPDSCMFSTEIARQRCVIYSGSAGVTFEIAGGSPGWQAQGRAPSVVTEVVVSEDGRSLISARNIYN